MKRGDGVANKQRAHLITINDAEMKPAIGQLHTENDPAIPDRIEDLHVRAFAEILGAAALRGSWHC